MKRLNSSNSCVDLLVILRRVGLFPLRRGPLLHFPTSRISMYSHLLFIYHTLTLLARKYHVLLACFLIACDILEDAIRILVSLVSNKGDTIRTLFLIFSADRTQLGYVPTRGRRNSDTFFDCPRRQDVIRLRPLIASIKNQTTSQTLTVILFVDVELHSAMYSFNDSV